jgi:hypothetical protein
MNVVRYLHSAAFIELACACSHLRQLIIILKASLGAFRFVIAHSTKENTDVPEPRQSDPLNQWRCIG